MRLFKIVVENYNFIWGWVLPRTTRIWVTNKKQGSNGLPAKVCRDYTQNRITKQKILQNGNGSPVCFVFIKAVSNPVFS